MTIALQAERPRPVWRLLLWLKWVLTLRGYQRSRIKAAGAVVALLVFMPMSIGYAFGAYYLAVHAHRFAPDVYNFVLGSIYLLWIFAPLIGFSVNESYDPSRLFIYPVSYVVIYACALAGGIFDYTLLPLVPVALALGLAASHSIVAAAASACLLALFIAQTIATSQALLLGLMGLLRSRRFRDLMIIVFPILGLIYYVGQNSVMMHVDRNVAYALLNNPLLHFLAYLPSGWAARGLDAIDMGDLAGAALASTELIGWTAVMVVAGASLMRRLSMGERGPSPHAADVRADVHAEAVDRAGKPFRVFPAGLAAVFTKERRYLWRDPQYKAILINMAYMLLVLVMPGFRPMHRETSVLLIAQDAGVKMRAMLPLGLSLLAPLGFSQLIMNIFGGEGAAAAVLLSFPTPRWQILLGKNLAHILVAGPILAIIYIALCLVFRAPQVLPWALIWIPVQLATMLGVGNVVSVLLPHRMYVRGVSYQNTGCGYAMLNLVASLAGLALLAIPAAVLALAIWLGAASWSIALALSAAVYAALVYGGGVWLADSLIERETPAIIARLTGSE